jgi:hypothetical protein
MVTPSASSIARCIAAPTGSRILIRAWVRPATPHTRCHGTSPPLTLSAAAVTRAPRGMPAISATWP